VLIDPGKVQAAGAYMKPIVALTAHALKEEQDRCRQAGFDDHVSKPIHFQSLTNKLMALRPSQSILDL
jgi:CheY-like chemotaxis protein